MYVVHALVHRFGNVFNTNGFTITIHFFQLLLILDFFRQIQDSYGFYSFQKCQFATFLRWKAKEKLSFSSEVFHCCFFSDFSDSVLQSTAEILLSLTGLFRPGQAEASWELSEWFPQTEKVKVNKRMKLFETLKDQDFMKQNSEIQRNGGFRLTLLVGLTLVHWANKTGKPFNLIGCAMTISNRDTYVYSVRPNQLEQMLLRKLMKSTDQRQIIYNYLCSQHNVKIQKVCNRRNLISLFYCFWWNNYV